MNLLRYSSQFDSRSILFKILKVQNEVDLDTLLELLSYSNSEKTLTLVIIHLNNLLTNGGDFIQVELLSRGFLNALLLSLSRVQTNSDIQINTLELLDMIALDVTLITIEQVKLLSSVLNSTFNQSTSITSRKLSLKLLKKFQISEQFCDEFWSQCHQMEFSKGFEFNEILLKKEFIQFNINLFQRESRVETIEPSLIISMMKSFSESCYGDLSIDWLNLFSELVTNTKIAKQFLRFGGLRIILSMLRIKHLNIVFQVLRILKDLQNHGLLKTVEFKNSSRQQLIKYLGEETLIKPIVKEVQETLPVSIPKPISIKSIIKKQVVKIFDEVPFRDVKPTYDHSTDNSNLNNKPMFKTMTHLDRTESLYLDENYRDIKSESKTKRPSSGRKKHTNERAIKVIDLDEKDTLDQSTTKLDTKELMSKSSNPSKSPMIPKTDKKNSGTKPITKPTKISNSNLSVAKKSSPVNSKSNINSVPKMRKSIVGIAPLKVPTVVEIKSQQKFEEIIPETTQSDLESEKIYSLIDNARSFDSNIRLNALVALQRMLSLEVPVQICDDICKVILERFNDDDTKISILCCEIIYHMVMLESLHDTLIDTGIIDQLVMNLSGYNLSVIEYSLWVLDRFCSNDVRIKQLYQLNATQSLAVMVHSGIENIRLHSQSILRKMAVIDDKSIRDAVEIILQNNPWAMVSKTWIDFHPWTPFPISNGELKKLAITK